MGAVSSATSTPAAPNPANSTAADVADMAPLARSSSERGTIVGRYARSARSKNVVQMAATIATRYTCGSVSHPPAAASGIEPSSAARTRSAQMSTGRRRRRSTHAPATNPTSSAATSSTARSSATSSGPALSVRIATNGRAIRVTNEPNTEIVAALHTRTNALFLRRLGVASASDGSGIGSDAGSITVRG